MHSTTINMSYEIYSEISAASQMFQISKKLLILEIFLKCQEKLKLTGNEIGMLTKYQHKCVAKNWHCMHVEFSDSQCDSFLFYRYKFRISLSKLLAVGFILFFGEIIKKLSKKNRKSSKEIKKILYSYTETKKIYFKHLKDSFKYFMLRNEKRKT